MDIRSTVLTLTILAVIAAIWSAVRASRTIQKGKRMPFYFKRRKLYDQAAGLILTALALGAKASACPFISSAASFTTKPPA